MRFLVTAFVTLFLFAGPAIAAAQTGTLTGRVIEPDTQAPVPGATVTVQGADAEAITDAGGNYELELEPGTYTLEVEAGADFDTRTIDDVEVTTDQSTTREVTLARSGGDAKNLAEYTVRAGFLEGSTGSVLAKQREAKSVTDIIGSEQMTRIGIGDAAEAVTRLVGLTIEDGKFAVIRGQPKRYTSTTFNGSPLPSLDPIRNLTPLDLFPAQAISNINVQKAYTANRIGSFGGGQVQIDSIGAPEENFLELSAEIGGNTESTGDKGFSFDVDSDDDVADVGDILEVPNEVQDVVAGRSSNITGAGEAFSDELEPQVEDLPIDKEFSLAGGRREELGGGTLGLRFAGEWGRDYREEVAGRNDLRPGAGDQVAILNSFLEERTEINTQLSALGAITWETDRHRLASNTFFIRDAQETTEISQGFFSPSDSEFRRDFLLEYEQREMLAQQFTGSHEVAKLDVDWRALTADAERELPDRRDFRFLSPNGTFNDLQLDRNPDLIRRWNSVDEDSETFGLDLSYPVIDRSALRVDLSGGVSIEDRERESTTRTFRFQTASQNLDQPIEELFDDGAFSSGTATFNLPGGTGDDYSGTREVNGYYLQTDTSWNDSWNVTAGVRSESAEVDVTTFQAGPGSPTPVNSGFDESEVLPSLNVSYAFADNMQVRFGASRSVSYPVMVEVSDTTFINPDTDETFRGNPNLGPATIDSFDFRWEWYPSSSEALIAGVFSKTIDDPIERTFQSVASGADRTTLRNSDEATVQGIETSGRVELGRLSDLIGKFDFLDNMYFKGNVAFMESDVDISRADTNATNLSRDLTGQAENIANAELGYMQGKHTATLTANHVGDRVDTAGIEGLPDEIQEDFTFVNAKWSYAVTSASTFSLELENIGSEDIVFTQGDTTTEFYEVGTTVTAGFSYRF